MNFLQLSQLSQLSQFSADEEIRPGVVLTHSARSGNNGTVCHAVSMSSKCSHLCAALQVFVTTTALSAELCWMSCKCSHHRTAPQVFVATTAPCAALCWMSCKCLHLFCFLTASFPHNHGTLCRAVLDVLQVLASSRCTASCRQNPAPCAALCWMSCKCSLLRTAPQVFVTATPCAALCWMSCKCSHLRAAPDVFITATPCAALC